MASLIKVGAQLSPLECFYMFFEEDFRGAVAPVIIIHYNVYNLDIM